MAIIKPFKAIRPTRDKAALATSRSYDEYSKKELRAVLNYNPYSFLHIIKPGYALNEELCGEERFKKVHETYEAFKEENIYHKDEKPQYYLHEKRFGNDVFWGIIAVAHVADYENNVIKKHEDTLKEREELFGNYLGITGFNAEPVLLTYPDSHYLNQIYKKYSKNRSEYEFMTHTKRLHNFWIVDDDLDIEFIEREFEKMDALYIADGHHRTASSCYLANKFKNSNPKHKGTECYNYFMAYMISDSNLKISAFNRFVKDLNGLSKEEFLEKLKVKFDITDHGKKLFEPRQKHHFSMFLDGKFFGLKLKNTDYIIENGLSDLDTHIIYKTILNPILGIKDLKTDPRIKCLPAVYDKKQLRKEVKSGNYAVGFGLYPVSVDQLKAVVNQDLRMPPKSTFIEPKLRSGLTIFEIID
jgi:uncharacterized protein (DUF1015 family)